MSRERVRPPSLRVGDVDLVMTTRTTVLSTTDDVEERSTEQDLEGSVLDHLNLQVDRDRTQLNGVILKNAEGLRGASAGGLHNHRPIRDNRGTKLLPDILPHHNDLTLGARAYGNRCLHVGNIAGFGRMFL